MILTDWAVARMAVIPFAASNQQAKDFFCHNLRSPRLLNDRPIIDAALTQQLFGVATV